MARDKTDLKASAALAVPEPDRSPAGLRATADRIDQRKESGFFVPGSAAGIYAEAMRALAREREQVQK